MNCNNTEQNGRDIVCKTHTSRSERELYRTCPTKLSKRELEDLYFALVDNNMSLKKTVNEQRDTIKILNTKVQRLSTARKNIYGKEQNDCCRSVKVMVNEQKELIVELKRENTRLCERVRLLNMRLCSAKQFTKRSPLQARCTRCSVIPTNSLKNASTSALCLKISDTNLKSAAVSCINTPNESAHSNSTVDTEDEVPEKVDRPEQQCNDNRCRTLIEELEQRIVRLDKEVSAAREDYAIRISSLETEGRGAREEGARLLQAACRAAEAHSRELTLQLSVERRRVAELETRVRAARRAGQLADCIQDHLATIYENRQELLKQTLDRFQSPRLILEPADPPSTLEAQSPPTGPCELTGKDEGKPWEGADDSGYVDANRSNDSVDDKPLNKLNQELMKKIIDLQTELDGVRISAVNMATKKEDRSPSPACTDNQIENQSKGQTIEYEPYRQDRLADPTPRNENVYIDTNSDKPNKNGRGHSHIPRLICSVAGAGGSLDNRGAVQPQLTSSTSSGHRPAIERIAEDYTEVNSLQQAEGGEDQDNITKTSFDGNTYSISDDALMDEAGANRKSLPKAHHNIKDTNESPLDGDSSRDRSKGAAPNIVLRKRNLTQENKGDEIFGGTSPQKQLIEERAGLRTPGESPRTYSVHHSSAKHHTYSVDHDTDCEISDLTDLPTEGDDKSSRLTLSPGEEPPQNWPGGSSAAPPTPSSVSEGELPTCDVRRKLSEGEKPIYEPAEGTSPQRMEATLSAIGAELALCRRLRGAAPPARAPPPPRLRTGAPLVGDWTRSTPVHR
ncbi:uncharacterized protein LOC101745524 isoform X2 [Bombyx mori]